MDVSTITKNGGGTIQSQPVAPPVEEGLTGTFQPSVDSGGRKIKQVNGPTKPNIQPSSSHNFARQQQTSSSLKNALFPKEVTSDEALNLAKEYIENLASQMKLPISDINSQIEAHGVLNYAIHQLSQAHQEYDNVDAELWENFDKEMCFSIGKRSLNLLYGFAGLSAPPSSTQTSSKLMGKLDEPPPLAQTRPELMEKLDQARNRVLEARAFYNKALDHIKTLDPPLPPIIEALFGD